MLSGWSGGSAASPGTTNLAVVCDGFNNGSSVTINGQARAVAGNNKTIGYTYNADGQLAGIVYPRDQAVTYHYDGDGRLTGAGLGHDGGHVQLRRSGRRHHRSAGQR